MGLWIIPAEVRAEWVKQYPDADIDAALKTTAHLMTSGKPRPRPAHYDRFIRARIRTEQAKAMQRAATKRELEARTTPECANAPACTARAQVSISIGGAILNFCIPCAEKERAAQLSQGAKPAPRAAHSAAEPSTTAQAEAEIARIRSLLNSHPRTQRTSSGPQPVAAMLAKPAQRTSDAPAASPRHGAPVPAYPEREPGSDDE